MSLLIIFKLAFANSSLFPCLEYYKYRMSKIVSNSEKKRAKKEVMKEQLGLCFDELTDLQKKRKYHSSQQLIV